MDKFNEIVSGWKNYIFKNETIEKIAKERIKICVTCDKYKNISDRCSLCGCFMPAKVRNESSKCPIKKW